MHLRIAAALSLLALRGTSPPAIVVRLDDIGMNTSVNRAMERVARTGLPISVSVLTVGPAFDDAVKILRRYPKVAVGVHLALNAEWGDHRWGPALGASQVPSLVDSDGMFPASVASFKASPRDVREVERELEAQVERALRAGLHVDYVDCHMGTALSTPELRAAVERIAKRHSLGISRYFGERMHELFAVPPDRKSLAIAEQLRTLDSAGIDVVVLHVAEDSPEMRALVDLNNPVMTDSAGRPLTARHRAAELELALSASFRDLLARTGARPLTYRDVVRERGLRAMRPPR